MLIKVSKVAFISSLVLTLVSCADSTPLEITRGLLGYIPPPPETSVGEELQLEYDRCMKIGAEKNCAQAAYDVVRVVKGLEPRPVPKGIVIILQGEGEHLSAPKSDNIEENENNE
jgi:hypothetical protein